MDNETLILSYEFSVRGPSLTISLSSSEGLDYLRNIFARLSTGEPPTIDLCSLDGIKCENVGSVRLILLRNRNEPARTLKVVDNGPGDVALEWIRHSEGWLETSELLDALEPGTHQYLNVGASFAEIKVTFREN